MKHYRLIASTLICLSLFAAPVRLAAAKDMWMSVRTGNLFIVGNAGERELRQVAAWLELFHQVFYRLLAKSVPDSSIPTTVVVFKSDSDFQPFKPLYQGRPASVAGYFQSGADANYIAFAAGAGDRSPFITAFHEYVHLHVNDNMPDAPLWLNEGLAEYYSTFEFANGDVVIGTPIVNYLRLLRQSELLPLETLFAVEHSSAHYNEHDKQRIFYAQSWALVHYLMLGNNGRRQSQIADFVNRLSAGISVENSFSASFGTSFQMMEAELAEYIRGDSLPVQRANFGAGPNSYGGMDTARLSEAEAMFYLGDLLSHINRPDEAEKYFQESIALDPALTEAHAALGMLRIRQSKFADARRHLQRAAIMSQNYLVHYNYAYALSREGMDADRLVKTYAPETAQAMRTHLRKAVQLAPSFAPSYQLLAFVNLVMNEELEESVNLVKRAQRLLPGRPELGILLGQLYLRQRDFASARLTLESFIRQSTDVELRSYAQSLLEKAEAGDGQVSQFRSNVSAPAAGAGGSVVETGRIKSGEFEIDNAGAMPTLEQLLEKYVTALGGQTAPGKFESRLLKGKVDVPGEFRGAALEIYAKSPNKFLTVITIPGMGVFRRGFNGSIGWAQALTGAARNLRGAELSELQHDADFYAPGDLITDYRQAKLMGAGEDRLPRSLSG